MLTFPLPTAKPSWPRAAVALFALLLGALLIGSAMAAELPISAKSTPSEPLAAFNACAAARLGHCDFYAECLERHYPCGKARYALAFGQKYCEKFAKVYDLNHRLAGFVGKTRTTLQQELIEYVNRQGGIGSCQKLEDFAFHSHSGAYVRQPFGICGLLDASALRTIITTIDQRDLLRPQLWRSSFHVASHCAGSLLRPFTQRLRRRTSRPSASD